MLVAIAPTTLNTSWILSTNIAIRTAIPKSTRVDTLKIILSHYLIKFKALSRWIRGASSSFGFITILIIDLTTAIKLFLALKKTTEKEKNTDNINPKLRKK